VSGFFLGSILLLQVATRRHWRFRSHKQAKIDSPLARILTLLRQPRYLPRWSYLAVATGVWMYAAIVTGETVRLSMDVRFLLTALLAITVVWLLILRHKPLSSIEKAALYVTAAVLVYLDSVVVHDQPLLAIATWAAILIMAAGTVVRLRLSTDRRFELTPLDLLVLFVALVLPSLSESLGLPDGGALGIAKLVILFYAIELLVSRTESRVLWLRLCASLLLVSMVLRPLL